MNGIPYARGGFIPSGSPDSDLVPALLGPCEPVVRLSSLRRWRSGELSLSDLLRENGIEAPREARDGDDDG